MTEISKRELAPRKTILGKLTISKIRSL